MKPRSRKIAALVAPAALLFGFPMHAVQANEVAGEVKMIAEVIRRRVAKRGACFIELNYETSAKSRCHK